MFSGIVEEIGTVVRIGVTAGGPSLTISCKTVIEDCRLGDSISVDGVCLTATTFDQTSFTADVQPVTARLSTLGSVRVGDELNLERSLASGQRLGGHYVQGHVDGTGRIRSARGEGAARIVEITVPDEISRYIVERGFIAVDGASLTVMSRTDTTISVSLVYHTQQHITLASKQIGDPVNLEADVVARYVERLIAPYERSTDISIDTLRKAGFI